MKADLMVYYLVGQWVSSLVGSKVGPKDVLTAGRWVCPMAVPKAFPKADQKGDQKVGSMVDLTVFQMAG